MKKLKKLVVGNWKMNPTDMDEAKRIAVTVKKGMKGISRSQVVLCPPHIYLSLLSKTPSGNLFLGAQDGFYEESGHFTGEVSSSQLYQFGVRFVIIGHSERRAAGETDAIVNKKARAVIVDGMTLVLCVGEKERDSHGDYLHAIRNQIVSGLKDVSKKSVDHIVVAYEPIWAIGAAEAMKPNDIHEMSIFIKRILHDMFGSGADSIRILYGGDVAVHNAEEIMREGFVQGVLVGRESLKPKDFVEIIRTVDSM